MKRTITGGLLIIIWYVLLFHAPPLVFRMAILGVGWLALQEFMKMTAAPQALLSKSAACALGILPLCASLLLPRLETVAAGLFLGLLLLFLFAVIKTDAHKGCDLQHNFGVMLRVGFAMLYIGFFTAHVNLLKEQENGTSWLLYLTLVTASSDSGAYFAGRLWGRHKLCPAVSPGKTIEGLVGGMALGIIAAGLLRLVYFKDLAVSLVLLLTPVIIAIGVLGDLTESLMKRALGVKDSGTILPGHGGLLDRFDSLLTTAPALYYFLEIKRLFW